MEYVKFKHILNTSLMSECLKGNNKDAIIRFLYHEKCLYPGSLIEDRIIFNKELNKNAGGYRIDITATDDQYSPNCIDPFIVKALWLPIKSGTLYSAYDSLANCHIIRNHQGEDQILFIIHPKSEHLFYPLLQEYHEDVLFLHALSLSSFRTILVSLPNVNGTSIPIMVKVSLDEEIHGIRRILTRRECALSVANTFVLAHKYQKNRELQNTIQFMWDPISFVPDGYEFGMIYRKMPDCLSPDNSNPLEIYPIPLLSIYGKKNYWVLRALTHTHGGPLLDFWHDILFEPFITALLELLLNEYASIEAHGQNLLLLVDKNHKTYGIMYRDMAGVNCLYSHKEWDMLPENLQKEEFYYFKNHIHDACEAFENFFARRGLFPLTKQMVKSHHIYEHDALFKGWYDYIKENHYLKNWTLASLDDDLHEVLLAKHEFYRYGFVENLFASYFIEILEERRLQSKSECEQMRFDLIEFQQTKDGTDVPPCTYSCFFYDNLERILIEHHKKVIAHPNIKPAG